MGITQKCLILRNKKVIGEAPPQCAQSLQKVKEVIFIFLSKTTLFWSRDTEFSGNVCFKFLFFQLLIYATKLSTWIKHHQKNIFLIPFKPKNIK